MGHEYCKEQQEEIALNQLKANYYVKILNYITLTFAFFGYNNHGNRKKKKNHI